MLRNVCQCRAGGVANDKLFYDESPFLYIYKFLAFIFFLLILVMYIMNSKSLPSFVVFLRFKGLVAVATLFIYFVFFNTCIPNHIPYIHPYPFTDASLHFLIPIEPLNLPVVSSRESNSGLPYSKLTRHAAPSSDFLISYLSVTLISPFLNFLFLCSLSVFHFLSSSIYY
jgi:hypothetical protein